MPKYEPPSDREVLEFILPHLVEFKLAGVPSMDTTERIVTMMRKRWPGMPLRAARSKLLRLRYL